MDEHVFGKQNSKLLSTDAWSQRAINIFHLVFSINKLAAQSRLRCAKLIYLQRPFTALKCLWLSQQ